MITKKNILILSIIGTFVILGTLILINTTQNMDNSDSKSPLSKSNFLRNESTQDENLYPLGMENNIWDSAISPFSETNNRSYLEILEDLKTGKINFVWEIWAMRSKCPKDYTATQCNATILAFIDAKYPSPDRENLKDLYTSYYKYETEMQKWKAPDDLEFTDKYEIIKEKRREVLGEEKAKLIFGMEEAQVNFIEGSHNFIQSTKDMNPDERVKKFEELKRKTYGSYYDNVVKREDRYEHYTTEIELREKELEGLSGEEKEKKLSNLEIKYFGKEKAGLISKARQEEKEEANKLNSLKDKEEAFLKNNPNLSDTEKEKKIQELRIQILGEEEAEMHSRRLEIEKLNNL